MGGTAGGDEVTARVKPVLTEEQIATQFFQVPLFCVGLVLNEEGEANFFAEYHRIRREGGELMMIGWPDGTTITYHRLVRGDPIDIECITAVYKTSVAMEKVIAK